MPLWRKSKPVEHPPLRGVNLGGWLVLEKWITPSLFDGLEAGDEYSLCRTAAGGIEQKVRRHRDTFITRDDFVWLKNHGIDAVRLPVGYWAFGDEPPYVGTIEYVDKAFQWAQETGLYLLLDMHGAPGSQNGWDHSGRAGECAWAGDERNIIKTLEVISKLARRYSRHPRLLGIELLNEPKQTVPKAALLRYYTAAYKLIREICGPNVWIVFHDNFRPRRWKRQLCGYGYNRVLIDTHQYQTFSAADKKLDITGHIDKTIHKIPAMLAKLRRYHPVVVGEWSLALAEESLGGLDRTQREAAFRAYGGAQLLAYHGSSAWFYWTYRTENPADVWNFRGCVERNWLPKFGDDGDRQNVREQVPDSAPRPPEPN